MSGGLAIVRRAAGALGLIALTGWVGAALTGIHSADQAVPEFCLSDMAARTDAPVNAAIIGSSVVRHHFRTDILDSLTGLTWHNLGISASFAPESYALAEAFLESKAADGLKLLVLDVTPFEAPHWENAQTLRRTWYMSVSEWWRCMRMLEWRKKPELALERAGLFTAGSFTRWIDWTRSEAWESRRGRSHPDAIYGWVPLDTTAERHDALKWSRIQFLEKPGEWMELLRSTEQDFDFRVDQDPPAVGGWTCPRGELDYHLAKMEDLREQAAARGIRCVFLFQMLWGTNGCLYFEAVEKWGNRDVLELMGTPEEAIHLRENQYDDVHLTPSGATVVSRLLARKLQAP